LVRVSDPSTPWERLIKAENAKSMAPACNRHFPRADMERSVKLSPMLKLPRAGPPTPEGFERTGKAQTKTVAPDWPARRAAGRTIGDDIYPVRNNASLLRGRACDGITF